MCVCRGLEYGSERYGKEFKAEVEAMTSDLWRGFNEEKQEEDSQEERKEQVATDMLAYLLVLFVFVCVGFERACVRRGRRGGGGNRMFGLVRQAHQLHVSCCRSLPIMLSEGFINACNAKRN